MHKYCKRKCESVLLLHSKISMMLSISFSSLYFNMHVRCRLVPTYVGPDPTNPRTAHSLRNSWFWYHDLVGRHLTDGAWPPTKRRVYCCCTFLSVITSIFLSNILHQAISILLDDNHVFLQIFVLDELRQVLHTASSKFLPNEHLYTYQQCLDSSALSHNRPSRSVNGHALSDNHIYTIVADLSS